MHKLPFMELCILWAYIAALTTAVMPSAECTPTTFSSHNCEYLESRSRQQIDLEAMDLLIRLEGYLPQARWDVNARRNGYGTAEERPGETISRTEAYLRSVEVFNSHSDHIRLRWPHLEDRQIAGLAVMRYNVGSFGPNLRQAIDSGIQTAISTQMSRYIKTQGKISNGLKVRRSLETRLMQEKILTYAK